MNQGWTRDPGKDCVETRDCGLSCGGHRTVTVEWAERSCGGPEEDVATADEELGSCEGPWETPAAKDEEWPSCGGPTQLAGTEDLEWWSCKGPGELAMVTLALDMGMGWISKIDEMPGVEAGNPEAEETIENLMVKRCLHCKSNCCFRRATIFQWVRAATEFGGL